MRKQVRVRFAPSPTGPLHIGGVRTALFNYLFAKKHGGTFVLRIEDTDQTRYVEGAEAYIIEALNWCGIPYDEGPGKDGGYGPYRQSERKEIYGEYAEKLIASGHAYYAFDTSESLDGHRKKHEAEGKTFIYNWHNRLKLDNSLELSQEETRARLESGAAYVIRFKSPKDQTVVLQDAIRGKIEIDSNTLDDKVLFKSDGMPTYHLANIVDDHLMEISHVIRGEEWLPSLALHVQLYRAFGWEPPVFAHLPLIMKPVGKGKLSKRDGEKGGFPVFPLAWENASGYRESGYYPEAVVNFLAMLGWNPGTEQELFNLEELIKAFTLERVNKSGARFDPDKTIWYNNAYLQQRSPKELLEDFIYYIDNQNIELNRREPEFISQVLELIRERANFPGDLWELGKYFFEAPVSYEPKAAKKQWKEQTAGILTRLTAVLEKEENFEDAGALEIRVKSWIQEEGLGFGQVMPPLRLSLVGEMKGPHIFNIMALLGKDESIDRIKRAIENLG
ncbi:glutamate--tRNA ligase [Lentiprolixibacter aurantiacus]|uniref:Glutamate--tRNA ligase n=1 Tax=Lentiprolixibacter aurantiacus TaxID=2993939 RepID=A0AAE3SMJ6_9FLAO|nr:glutamate--tRNA ligase [Lentiprolixibacter aurantiacus]MCX2718515.1 glutamate--tRNA ligase [Lentiprolixibacter aurantiacus]